MLTKLLVALLSCTGVLAGLALSRIALEELHHGKKYFLAVQRGLFILLSLASMYFFYTSRQLFMIPLVFIISAALFVLGLKIKTKLAYIFHYLFFVGAYLLLPEGMLLAALLFLYGLPVGTLLQIHHE